MAYAYRCSDAQRATALRLMREMELDERVVTLMTIRQFDLAGLPPPFEGHSLDDAVRNLSPRMCSDLIASLTRELGDEEEADA